MSGVYKGTIRECSYSVAKKGIGGIMVHWGLPRGCRVALVVASGHGSPDHHWAPVQGSQHSHWFP